MEVDNYQNVIINIQIVPKNLRVVIAIEDLAQPIKALNSLLREFLGIIPSKSDSLAKIIMTYKGNMLALRKSFLENGIVRSMEDDEFISLFLMTQYA